jgi:hypothetical protein
LVCDHWREPATVLFYYLLCCSERRWH